MAAYPFPWDLFLGLSRDLYKGMRPMQLDAQIMVSRMEPEPDVRGSDKIPARGGVMIVANHYQRRGLWIGWSAAIITNAVAQRRVGDSPAGVVKQEPHWLVTGGLRWLQFANRGAQIPLSDRLFTRVAACYEMTALPLEGAWAQASAVRRWLSWAQKGEAIAMFPEGLGGSSARLKAAEAGFDALCRVLWRQTIPILPVGIWEEKGRLTVCFGEPALPGHVPNRHPGECVMRQIAALLPRELRGPFGALE